MGKLNIGPAASARKVQNTVFVEKVVIKEVPGPEREVIKYVETRVEVPVMVEKIEVREVQVPVYIEVPVEVVRVEECQVEVIREVKKTVLVEVPKIIEKHVIQKEAYVPVITKVIIVLQTILNIYLLIK